MGIGSQIIRISFLCLLGVFLSACEWPQYKKIVMSEFADDSEFNTGLDSNKRTQLEKFYYYNPNTSVVLQCLNSSSGWTTLGNGTVGLNPDGSLRNFNTSRPDRAVYWHSWDGAWLLQVAGNCAKTITPGPKLVTDRWTYEHTGIAITLRFTDVNGVVLPNYNDSERNCFNSDQTPDYWERHFHCNDPANDASYLQHLDESISRSSNYSSAHVSINPAPYFTYGWYCSLNVTFDGVNKGNYGSPLGTNVFAPLGDVKFGSSHTISFIPIQCQFRHEYCRVNGCSGTNLVLSPGGSFDINPAYNGAQTFNFVMKNR